jgi:alcohol dehydrogenase, propanol-preferring
LSTLINAEAAVIEQTKSMQAMVLDEPGHALELSSVPRPQPGPDELLVKIAACAVCRTDLHVIDGELPDPKLPLIPGHEIVGRVEACGANVDGFSIGQRIGIPWLGWTCGECWYCRNGMENLCPKARFTGYQINGGYAGYTVADARYCFRIPDAYSDVEAPPCYVPDLLGIGR